MTLTGSLPKLEESTGDEPRLLVLVESDDQIAVDDVARFIAPLHDRCVVSVAGNTDACEMGKLLATNGLHREWTPEADESDWPRGAWESAASAISGNGHVLVAGRDVHQKILESLLSMDLADLSVAAGVHVLQHDAAGWRVAQLGVIPDQALPTVHRDAERRVILIRHGECNNFSPDGKVHAGTDLPLTDRGRTQASALSQALDTTDAKRLYINGASARVRETAALMAGSREIESVVEFREISLGNLEGSTVAEVLAAEPTFFDDPAVGLPGGESFIDVAERAGPALDNLLQRAEDRDVVIVAHGGVNRALLFHTIGSDPRRTITVRQDWAGVSTLECRGGRWVARTINWMKDGLAEIAVGRGGAPLTAYAGSRIL